MPWQISSVGFSQLFPTAKSVLFSFQCLLNCLCVKRFVNPLLPGSKTQTRAYSFCLCITIEGIKRVRLKCLGAYTEALSFSSINWCLSSIQRNCLFFALTYSLWWFHIFWACSQKHKLCCSAFAPWENLVICWHLEGTFRKWEDFRKQNVPTCNHYKTLCLPSSGIYRNEKAVIALLIALFSGYQQI